jgi:hypothetical protein
MRTIIAQDCGAGKRMGLGDKAAEAEKWLRLKGCGEG